MVVPRVAGSERFHHDLIEAPVVTLSSGKFNAIEEFNRPAESRTYRMMCHVRYHTPEEEIAWFFFFLFVPHF
ncbi:hypothetical protein BGW80DRAFT_1307540 [Lactifluus volemus]|nr:hypothetical protein BGW80DRAFT_1307540 [Lactifluus volemus]